MRQNNRSLSQPDLDTLAATLERGIVWLDSHDEEILGEANPMLWWMVREAAGLSGDRRLAELFARYDRRYLHRRGNMWVYLFDEDSREPLRYMEVEQLPYYNQHFLYTLTCDRLLGAEESIRRQNEPDFCDHYPYSIKPACVTHQLMGLRFLQRRQCGDQGKVAGAIARLQDRLVGQLTWDVRVVDVYLQRVLMLVDSGARARVKPVWLQRVVDAQLPDGGWGGLDPILALGLGRPLCFTAQGLAFRRPRGNFHATAQGVWLMSLLLKDAKNADAQ